MGEWKPIETAPKDGTRVIIAYIRRDGRVTAISSAKWVTAEEWADIEGGDPSRFIAGWYEPDYEDELRATHWMPLPETPKQEANNA